MRAKLEHDHGARLWCRPLDPWRHHAGHEVYRANRVELSWSDQGRHEYLHEIPAVDTVEDSWKPQFGMEDALACLSSEAATCSWSSSEQVSAVDQRLEDIDGAHDRGYTFKETTDDSPQ